MTKQTDNFKMIAKDITEGSYNRSKPTSATDEKFLADGGRYPTMELKELEGGLREVLITMPEDLTCAEVKVRINDAMRNTSLIVDITDPMKMYKKIRENRAGNPNYRLDSIMGARPIVNVGADVLDKIHAAQNIPSGGISLSGVRDEGKEARDLAGHLIALLDASAEEKRPDIMKMPDAEYSHRAMWAAADKIDKPFNQLMATWAESCSDDGHDDKEINDMLGEEDSLDGDDYDEGDIATLMERFGGVLHKAPLINVDRDTVSEVMAHNDGKTVTTEDIMNWWANKSPSDSMRALITPHEDTYEDPLIPDVIAQLEANGMVNHFSDMGPVTFASCTLDPLVWGKYGHTLPSGDGSSLVVEPRKDLLVDDYVMLTAIPMHELSGKPMDECIKFTMNAFERVYALKRGQAPAIHYIGHGEWDLYNPEDIHTHQHKWYVYEATRKAVVAGVMDRPGMRDALTEALTLQPSDLHRRSENPLMAHTVLTWERVGGVLVTFNVELLVEYPLVLAKDNTLYPEVEDYLVGSLKYLLDTRDGVFIGNGRVKSTGFNTMEFGEKGMTVTNVTDLPEFVEAIRAGKPVSRMQPARFAPTVVWKKRKVNPGFSIRMNDDGTMALMDKTE